MGNSCRKVAVDIIPDEEVMLKAVAAIKALEELLQAGQPLTTKQRKQLQKVIKTQ